MANRIGAFSVVMLAGMAAHGQSVEMAMRQSYEKAIFFSGQVKLDDASAPPEPVAINRVCNGQSHFETWTDAKGRFSFQVTAGGNDAGQADATQNSTPPSDLTTPSAFQRGPTCRWSPLYAIANCRPCWRAIGRSWSVSL